MKIEITEENFFIYFKEIGSNRYYFSPNDTQHYYEINVQLIPYINGESLLEFGRLNNQISFIETKYVEDFPKIKFENVTLNGSMIISQFKLDRVNSNTTYITELGIKDEFFYPDGNYVYHFDDEYISCIQQSKLFQMLKKKIKKNISSFI